MLKEEDAIRIEYVTYKSRPKEFVRIFIFSCRECRKELRIQRQALAVRTGLCNKCVKHKATQPHKRTYNSLIMKAKRYNQSIELSFDDFLFFTELRSCYYCGEEIIWQPYGSSAYHLDRKDSSKGYTLENSVVCCFRCNRLKSNFYDSDEFQAIMKVHEVWAGGSDKEKKELMYYLVSWKDSIAFEQFGGIDP
jgi:hypothetical protein